MRPLLVAAVAVVLGVPALAQAPAGKPAEPALAPSSDRAPAVAPSYIFLLDDAVTDGLVGSRFLAEIEGCELCEHPAELHAWYARLHPDKVQELAKLDRAMLEQSALPAAWKEWPARAGYTPEAWAALGVRARFAALTPIAKAARDALLKGPAATDENVDWIGDAYALNDFLEPGDFDAIDDWVTRSIAVKSGLGRARDAAAKRGDPALIKAVEDAASAPDAAAQFGRLERLFDGHPELGNVRVLRADGPNAPDQRVDASAQRVLPGLLGSALIEQLKGTRTGEDALRFLEKRPFTLRIGSENYGTLASYDGRVINVGTREVERFVRERSTTMAKLVSDRKLLADLAEELAPTFVHEVTHQRQDEWMRPMGLRIGSQEDEIQAMEKMTLFVLEKVRGDKRYAQRLADRAATSGAAQTNLAYVGSLARGGFELFDQEVRASYKRVPPYEAAPDNRKYQSQLADAASAELAARRAGARPAGRGGLRPLRDLVMSSDPDAVIRAASSTALRGWIVALAGNGETPREELDQARAGFYESSRFNDAQGLSKLHFALGPAPSKAPPPPSPGEGRP